MRPRTILRRWWQATNGPADRVPRLVGAAAATVGAVLLADREAGFRAWEARAAGALLGLSTDAAVSVPPSGTSLFWDLGTARADGVMITAECTSAYALIVLLLLTGAVILWPGVRASAVVVAAVAAATVLSGVNLLRILLIALTIRQWGADNWFDLTHVYVGTALSLLAAMLAALVFALLLRRTTGRRRSVPGR
ncbi:hypothetical protein ABZ078_01470 [Streptomyces sp. NPDC006385]|uniref:hypothetical protein n=1 Tax=Streptomyces sp. NPDC006385 TaxID=3156761 RepID=UPI0033B85791